MQKTASCGGLLLCCSGGDTSPGVAGLDPQRLSMEFISQLSRTQSKSGLNQETLEYLENLFNQNCGSKQEIGLEQFQKIIKSKNVFFAERLFLMFDTDNSGTISREEFISAMRRFARLSPEEKLQHVFRIYDIDGDGFLQLSEIRDVIKECMKENNFNFLEAEIDELAFMLFSEADADRSGAISFQEFKHQLLRHPGLLENLSMSVEQWLIPPMPKKACKCHLPRKLHWNYIRNNVVSVLFFFVLMAIVAALFTARVIEYDNTTPYFMTSRGAAQCLNFLCSLTVLFVCRRTITWLRVNGCSEFLPLDQHIYFHKLVGVLIFFFAIVHTIGHLLNFAHLSRLTGVPFSTLIIMPHYRLGWVGGAACITGWIMLTTLIIMVIASLPFVRRNEYFEVFYYTHLLYVVFFALLILHGGNFWKWFIAPGCLFAVEQIIKVYRFFNPTTGYTYLHKAVLLPSKVTHLVIKRPSHFVYHPGDYVFINVPAIAKHEWHPFTISSAPEEDGVFWLHVRGNGNWTNSLYGNFQRIILKASEKRKLAKTTDVSGAQGIYDQNKNFKRSLVRTISNKILKRERSIDITVPVTPNPAFLAPPILEVTESPATSLYTTPQEEVGHDNASFVMDSADSLTTPEAPPPTTIQTLSVAKKAVRLTKSSPDAFQMETLGTVEVVKKRTSLATGVPSGSVRRMFSYRHRPSLVDLGLVFKRAKNKQKSMDEKWQRRKHNIVIMKSDLTNRSEDLEMGLDANSIETKEGDDSHTILSNEIMQIKVDGPYGSPSSHIFHAQHAVLIATGIGVTPFASILQSIVDRYRKSRHTCPWCQKCWTDKSPSNVMKLKKVDFFWINRTQDAFEWFVSLLSDLEVEQAQLASDEKDRFLDIHMYITSALHKTDMKALGLQIALDLLHDKEKRDLITGLKTRTRPGRPDWDKVFRDLASQKKGKVTVFFCGPPEVARMLHTKSNEYGFTFRKEIF